jgi:choline dehydrogenase
MVHAIGALSALGEETAGLGVKRPLVVTDQGIVKAGLLDEALKPLRAAGLDPVTYDQVRANPGIALVDAGAAYYKKERCDGLVAIGGGSSIDSAKGIGVVAVHGGSIVQYEWGKDPIHSRIPPLVAVPTTAGTGSEVTVWAVITDPDRKIKFNVGGTPNIASWVALIDPQLSVNLPAGVTAGTGMDALTHAIECYTMAYGTDSAGAAHAMSQSAGGVHDAPHGALTGRLLAPVMEYNYAGEPERFARIAQALGLDTSNKTVWKAAEVAVEYVYQLTEDLDIPSLNELGFAEDEIPMLAKKAQEDSQTIGNPRDVDARNYEKIYARAFEAGRHRKVARALAHAGS